MIWRRSTTPGRNSVHVEVGPAAEQRPAQAAGADPLAAGRDELKRVRTSSAARAMAKLPRRSRFLPRKLACDPRFAPHNAHRLAWQRARMVELSSAHGHVSRGVGAIVAAAAWLYAAGEFAAELAALTGDLELFKTAGWLTGTARQHELAAWELCAREGAARPRSDLRPTRIVIRGPGGAVAVIDLPKNHEPEPHT
jgi:hypothetical protein